MQNEVFFSWQSKFYDHIIRDEKALNNIRRYIKNNPSNYKNDFYNSNNKSERKIDEMVYQLYDLTPEEIAIIENK